MSVKLYLEDNDRIIRVTINKDKLAGIPFFSAMDKFKEADQNKIKIHVPNANVSYDIVMGICGDQTNIGELPVWKHRLESVKCYEYFGMEFDYGLLRDLEIPVENYSELFNVFNVASNKFVVVKLINKFLPVDYDFSGIDKTVLGEILEVAREYHIFDGARMKIRIWNSREDVFDDSDRLMTNCYPIQKINFRDPCTTIVTDKIIYNGSWAIPQILDANTLECVFELEGGFHFFMCISADSTLCAYTCSKKICIHHIAKKCIINEITVPINNYVRYISFSFDSSKIFAHVEKNQKTRQFIINVNTRTYNRCKYDKLAIYNLCKSPVLTSVMYDDKEYSVAFSNDGNYVAEVNKNNIDIINLASGKIMAQLIGHTDFIWTMKYSPDDSQIVTVSNDRSIMIWDSKTGNCVRKFEKILFMRRKNEAAVSELYLLMPNNYNLIQLIKKLLD